MMSAHSETILADFSAGDRKQFVDLGKRAFEATADEVSGEYRLCDTFDGQIGRAKGLLLACADGLILFNKDGSALRQGPASDFGLVAKMPSGPVTRALSDIVSPLRAVLPLGEGRFTRQPFAVLDTERKTQARCEIWTLSGAGKRKVRFATIQNIRGYDKVHERLRGHLAGIGVEAQAGFGTVARRLFPKKAGYTARPAVIMTPEHTAFETANALIRAHLAVARQNEAGTIKDHDTEFLHDYRVALRKVRSVLSLCKGVFAPAVTAELQRRFGDLMAETGRLRDLDVYLLERDRYVSLVPASLHPGLELLFESFAEKRAEEQARLAKYLKGKSYCREVEELAVLFDRPVSLEPGPQADRPVLDYSRRLIWKRYRRVCKIASGIDQSTADARLHELRIHCKKLRYAMELFAPLYDQASHKRLVKALKTLQDTLGNFNDYSVQQIALQGFVDELSGRDDLRKLDMASSVGALITVLHQKQLEEQSLVVDKLATFNTPGTRKGFKAMFQQAKRNS